MAEDIVVRDAQPGDGAPLAGIWLDVARYYGACPPDASDVPNDGGLAEGFEDNLKEDLPENRRTLVAEVRGEQAGWVTGHLEPPHTGRRSQRRSPDRETRLVVEALVVALLWPTGHRVAVTCEIEAWAALQGATMSTLDTYIHRSVSVPFYERRIGYSRRSLHFVKRL